MKIKSYRIRLERDDPPRKSFDEDKMAQTTHILEMIEDESHSTVLDLAPTLYSKVLEATVGTRK